MKPATNDAILIRPAVAADLPTLGRLGAALARAHHEWDPRRFFTVPKMHEGYAWWLGRELKNRGAVVLTAERRGRVIGYAYGRLEERDWNSLRDACGVAVDLIVEKKSRSLGAGRLLADALLEALREKGAPQVVLEVAEGNAKARQFFGALGFRPVMTEMARDLDLPRKRQRHALTAR
jgi:ribosomal protein S18 acetylase RimI-like enzyme